MHDCLRQSRLAALLAGASSFFHYGMHRVNFQRVEGEIDEYIRQNLLRDRKVRDARFQSQDSDKGEHYHLHDWKVWQSPVVFEEELHALDRSMGLDGLIIIYFTLKSFPH